MKAGLVPSLPEEKLVLIRQSYLTICDGNACAAALLNHLEYCLTWKRQTIPQARLRNQMAVSKGQDPTQDTDEWWYESFDGFADALLSVWGRNVVIGAMSLLLEKKFVARRHNPTKGWDRKWQYHFEVEAVREAMIAHRLILNDASFNSGQSIVSDQTMQHPHVNDASFNSGRAITEITNRDNTEITHKEESTLPTVPTIPPSSSHDEDAHAHSCSLCSETDDIQPCAQCGTRLCWEHRRDFPSETGPTRILCVACVEKHHRAMAQRHQEEKQSAMATGEQPSPIASTTATIDEQALAEQMQAAFPLPARATSRASSSKPASKESKIVPIREAVQGPSFASKEASALHRQWKKTYGAYGDARWDVESLDWIASEGGTFEQITLIYMALKREKPDRPIRPELVKTNWYRLSALQPPVPDTQEETPFNPSQYETPLMKKMRERRAKALGQATATVAVAQ